MANAEKFIRISNWKRFQHYKDRNPPWIKLHRELLSSRTWVALDDASRVLAIACMLLAAATDNQIPLDPAYIRRVAYLNQDPDFTGLLTTQFIEIVDETGSDASTLLADASTPLATASTLHTNARPETETETKTKTKKRRKAFVQPTLAEIAAYCHERGNQVDPQLWFDHYEANGWKVGRNPMNNWKAAVRTWEKNGNGGNSNGAEREPRPSVQVTRAINNIAAVATAFGITPVGEHCPSNGARQAARSCSDPRLLEGEVKKLW